MKLNLACLLGLLVVCSGQYTSDTQNYNNNIPSTICQAGHDCVNKAICVNGEIDTSGGGLLDKRIKETTCGGNNVCCRIPGYIEPLGPDQCNVNEDCVSPLICSRDGVIDVTGGGLIDKRIKPDDVIPSTCENREHPGIPAVCCLIPYKCPDYQECVLDSHCGVDGFIDKSGSLSTYLQKGIPCTSDDGSIQGVCCTPGPIKETLKPATKCGIRHDNKNIQTTHGINDAEFAEFPWMAIIFLADKGEQLLFQCGATLISDRHVLTAAHCVEHLKAADIGVRFGEYEVSSVKEPIPYVDRYVNRIIIHKDYNSYNTRNNIALIELIEPIKFDYHINTICLTDTPSKFSYNKCVASGWGKDHFGGNYQHILKKLDLPYVEHDRCQNLLRLTELSRYFQLHNSFACAGGEKGIDTCTGDGGGPFVCPDPISGQYYLAGIISSGVKCGKKDVPGLYVDVPYFSKWIDDQINLLNTDVGYSGSYTG